MKITEEGEIIDNGEEEKEEDVPPDFFDDFAKDDFLEGLDIVDEASGDSPEKNPSRSRSRSVPKKDLKQRKRDRKQRNRSRRSRSRSNSRPSKTEVTVKPKRKTFLEEISEKLNQIKKPSSLLPTPIPYNVPTYNNFFTPFLPMQPFVYPLVPPYNPNYLNGTPSILPSPFILPATIPQPTILPQPTMPQPIILQPTIPEPTIPQPIIPQSTLPQPTISPQQPSRVHTTNQKRLTVISRCHEVINILTETGRFIVKPSEKEQNKPKMKFQSPLRNLPVVKFAFTTRPRYANQDAFTRSINRVIERIRLYKSRKKDSDDEDLAETVVKAVRRFGASDKDAIVEILKTTLDVHASSALSVNKKGVEIGTQCQVVSCSMGTKVEPQYFEMGGYIGDG